MVVAEAYDAGAGHVTVIWADDAVTRLAYEHVEKSYFEQTPEWKRMQLDSLAQDGACFVFIEGADPAALKGIDPAKPAAASKARNTQCKVFRRGLDYNINPWCIAGAPVVAWAHEVFPGDADEVAIYKLWNAILHTARADGQDPESDWELHDAAFEKNLRFLNDNRFDYLHYTAANGTDLTIGMTKGHEWAGGKGKTPDGHPFFPNIPTEEVFTSPDRMRADGIVYSAMPLIHHGNKVEDFWIKFEGGRVVDYDARVGKATLGEALLTPMKVPLIWARSRSFPRTLRSAKAAFCSMTRSMTRMPAVILRWESASRSASRVDMICPKRSSWSMASTFRARMSTS